jgi:hypothetical protein
MRTYENKFDQLVQELLKQKQVFERLVLENQELHRQLAALRAGQGLFVEIGGERFALLGEQLDGKGVSTSPVSSQSTPTNQPQPVTRVLPAFGRSEELGTQAPSTTTQPMTALSASKPPSPTSGEEETATLRRELTGSLMLD